MLLFLGPFNGHQFPLPSVLTTAGINNGKMNKLYISSPKMSIVAICISVSIPDVYNAAMVPTIIMHAVTITVPIFFIAVINAL